MDTSPSPSPATTGRRWRTWRRSSAVVAAALLVLTGLVALPGPAEAADDPGTVVHVLYDDAIRAGWANWSWAEVDLDHRDTVASGDSSVAVDAGPWEAFFIGRNDAKPLPLHGSVRFEVNGGQSDAPVGVRLVAGDGQSASIPVETRAGTWTSVEVDLAEFGGFGAFSGLWFDNLTDSERPTYYIDDVRIVTGEAPPPSSGPTLAVTLGAATITRTVTDPASGIVTDQAVTFPHPISDGVYGMNFASDPVREELGVAVNRWGGNSTERYNHLVSSTNAGTDWFYMNVPDEVGADDTFEKANQADGTATIMTLPMLGWVAKDRGANCSYPTNDVLGPAANAGPQDADEPHGQDNSLRCGNGFRGGEWLPGADQTLTSRAADERFAADWVRELVATHGTAAAGGVEMYALGNEPGLWYSTHRDVHPEPLGRAELIDKNQRWARAVKDVDPSADVIGPVLWSGYSYYVTSEEILRGDRPGPETPTFVGDYLDGMRTASDQAGARLLDTLAVNFYDDRVYGTGSDELRLEATRQLWDPEYAPTDWWVVRDFLYGDGSAVIPRLNSLIDRHYPGTDLAITEYNFGGDNTLAGGLAQADALGIFGREGLEIATVWDPFLSWVGMTEDQWGARPLIDAFRLYRNYDGRGSRFGDVANLGTSSDEGAVAIHAATRTADGALTLVVINKTRAEVVSPLTITGGDGGTVSGSAERFDYHAGTGGEIVAGAAVAVGNGTTVTLPARSATVLVLPGGGDPAPDPEPDPDPAPDPDPEPDPDPAPGPEPGPDPEPDPTPTPTLPTVDGGMTLIAPPTSTREGGPLDSPTAVHLWLEHGPTTLTGPIRVDRTEDGAFRGNSLSSVRLAPGTTVCSWYVFGDRLQDRGALRGTIDFGGAEVLGVITRSRNLRASAVLDGPSTTYTHQGAEGNDRFTLERRPEGTVLTVDFRLGRGTDAIRVLTDCG
ncbi:MAG: glycoside hydrolase family 44 protein [Actinomycetota bacterium]